LTTNRDQWPPHIQERYPKPGKPWFLVIVAGIFVLVIGAFVATGVERVINPPLNEKLLAWEIKDKNNVEVIFEINRPVDMNVWCLVRAQDFYMTDIGYAILELPKDGNDYKQINYNLKTASEAFTVEIINCDDDPNSTLFPASQFSAGVEIPQQDPPAIDSGK
jgi:hypothetical protein